MTCSDSNAGSGPKIQALIERTDSVETDAFIGAPECLNQSISPAWLGRASQPSRCRRTFTAWSREGVSISRFRKGAGTKAPGPRIRLPHPADPEFFSTYYSIANEEPPKPAPGTFAALIEAWQKGPEWNALAPKTSMEAVALYRPHRQRLGNLRSAL